MRKANLVGPAATTAAIVGLLAPLAAQAHPGHDFGPGLAGGLMHPLTGVDHLIALLAVGLWLAERGRNGAVGAAGVFLGALAGGAVLAWSNPGLPFVEPGVALSVVIFGLLLCAGRRLPTAPGVAVIGAFAMVHGYAHGAALVARADAVSYLLGFVGISAVVLGCAGLLGRSLARSAPEWLRAGGVAVTLTGMWLAATL
jgi:urease accessory protein